MWNLHTTMAGERERIGDLFPPIKNCKSGMLGVLTPDQVNEVKSILVSEELSKQEVLPFVKRCRYYQGGKEVVVLYYPKILRGEYGIDDLRVGSFCSETDCEYNTSEKP